MSTRDRILDAAAEVIKNLGLARATTREIAKAAGFSEATLYKHFSSKEALFLRVLMERMPNFVSLMKSLQTLVGKETVAANLLTVAEAALNFYCHTMPIGSSLFSEPDLLESLRSELRSKGAGPHRANQALSAYLRAEQRRGRIKASANYEAAAYLLLGACFQRAYWSRFLGEEIPEAELKHFAAECVKGLMEGLTAE